MNRILVYSISFLLLFSTLSAQTTYPSGVQGCIARWTFDDTNTTILKDRSLNGNDGTSTNLVSSIGWNNITNGAKYFNGTNISYSQIISNNSLSPQNVTVIALVRPETFYSGLCNFTSIYSKGYPFYVTGSYQLTMGDYAYDVNCNTFSPNNMEALPSFGTAFNAFPNSTPSYISTNKWHFIASSYDGSVINTYQQLMSTSNHNSFIQPKSTLNISSTLGINNSPVTLGFHLNPTYPYNFKGDMDEVILFNKALSQEEIQSIYDYLYYNAPLLNNEIVKQNISCYISNNRLYILGIKDYKEYKLILTNSLGQKIASNNINRTTNSINIKDIQKAQYIVSIYSSHESYQFKIMN